MQIKGIASSGIHKITCHTTISQRHNQSKTRNVPDTNQKDAIDIPILPDTYLAEASAFAFSLTVFEEIDTNASLDITEYEFFVRLARIP